MDWQMIALLALTLIGLLLLLLGLKRRAKKRKEREQAGQSEPGEGDGDAGGRQAEREAERKRNEAEREAKRKREEEERRAQEERKRQEEDRKVQKVKTVLNGDDQLARLMLKYLEQTGTLQDVSADEEAVREMARKLTPEFLEVLLVANDPRQLDIELGKTVSTVRAIYPTPKSDILPIEDYGQIADLPPEALALPEDEFYSRLAQKELLLTQYFDEEVNERIGYMLLDVSASMRESMANKLPRHVVGRGLALNLLLRAKQGKSKYFLRPFDGGVHPLVMATTPAEIEKAMQFIIERAFSGGNTNIIGAIQTAVEDIRSKGGDFAQAEILLLSDGEDSSTENVEYIKSLLGDDIRLHVCLIGRSNEYLKEVAATYQEIR